MTCRVNDCGKPVKCRGYCSMHYTRLRRYGTIERSRIPNEGCNFPNCINKHYGLGYCKIHYFRLVSNKRYGPRRLTFLGNSILLDRNPRKGMCSKCGKCGYTHIHHEQYDKTDPLKHTVELCPSCHAKESWSMNQIRKEVVA
jgi:hypothetical protein